MKKILGLDLGTNSIGWALVENDFEKKEGQILGMGSRIIPMSQDVMDKFGSGQSISQTAERTDYRGVRRLNERHLLRRERLHRVLNVLGFLPEHYANAIDFDKHLGQFKSGVEIKLNYCKNKDGKHEFLFMDSFLEMVKEFKIEHPELFYKKQNGEETKIPYDWTIYYLRKKALEEKISKEELAWLLLNFNQKRGYYQLRGEDDEDNSKVEEFHSLKVVEVEATEDKNARGVWYNIHLENGWIYRRQSKEPLDSWLNKNKEFIVTTNVDNNGKLRIDKEGNVKRNFRAVDSEKDWIAIKKKTEKDINQSNKTVGCFIYDSLLENPSQKLNGKLVKTIKRKLYKEELKAILTKQIELHAELKDREFYHDCIEELYPNNEAHRNTIREKGFDYLFVEDILFYQRPLKSKKSTMSTCQYELRTYKKLNKETGEEEWIKEPLKCISKSNPLFIEFRLWQFLRNLKIYEHVGKKDVDLTARCLQNENEWCELFDFLNDKKEVEQKNIIKYFTDNKRLDKNKKDVYCWNYVADKKYPMNELRAQLISRLKKVNGVDSLAFLNKEREMHLWHIIYSVKDKGQFEQALRKYAAINKIDEDSFVENFKKFPPFKSDYGSYSEKAIKKLLPLMRVGKYWDKNTIDDKVKQRIADITARVEAIEPKTLPEEDSKRRIELDNRMKDNADDDIPSRLIKSFLPFYKQNSLSGLNTYQACYSVYGRHSEIGDIQKWNTPADIDKYLRAFKQHSLRNPIVEQVVTETLRTVRDIWQYHGKSTEKYFNEIHVELGREMKNSAGKREKMSKQITENENTNERIKMLLQELKDEYQSEDIRPYSPSHQEILKIYEEGVFQNPKVDFNKVKEDEVTKIRKSASPTKSEIVRYKLWLEQKYISPYTGKPIPLSGLFSSDYQIEHIIPQSRYFDDSLGNKVICESAVNAEKSNKTAFEFMKNPGKSIIDLGNGNSVRLLSFDEFEAHCNFYFKKNRIKLKNLLSEDIPDGFINRQMNDSRYISKLIKGLLSNIVREDGEQEATSKNLLPVSGAVTSKLKQDWGLNDKWNDLIAPRFKRLNELTNSNDFGYMDYQKDENGKPVGKQFFRLQVPKEAGKLNKKRIDHRHHSLDALVIASCTREHQNYLNSLNSEKENYGLREGLLIRNKQGDLTKHFQLPWTSYSVDVKDCLETTVVSFKQNLRVINKTNNKTWQWREEDGKLKKKLVKQKKGNLRAIRRSLHDPMPYGKIQLNFAVLDIAKNVGKRKLIISDDLRSKVELIYNANNENIGATQKFLKENPIVNAFGISVTKTHFKISSIKYGKRKEISFLEDTTYDKIYKKILKVGELSLQIEFIHHLNQYINEPKDAFSEKGIGDFNSKRLKEKKTLVNKIRIVESGEKRFQLGKSNKYVESAEGTNLYFAVYWNSNIGKRDYESIAFLDIIKYRSNRLEIESCNNDRLPLDFELGDFLFSLSPNDLVYVPSSDELENPNLFDIRNLSKEQVGRIYKMVSSTKKECHFTPFACASEIRKNENGTNSKSERIQIQNDCPILDDKQKPVMIKDSCWKLKVDRLGNITKVIRHISQELYETH